MSYPKFDSLIAEYPEETDAIQRLRQFLARGEGKAVTLDRLVALTNPRSVEALSLILAELVQRHLLRKFVRVESPEDRGGIIDYPSLLEVPDKVVDLRSGEEIVVTPENLRVLFDVTRP